MVTACAVAGTSLSMAQSVGDTLSVADTIGKTAVKENFFRRVEKKRVFKATYIGVPLIAGGLIEKSQDKKFRRLRNDFMPNFRNKTDDYIQYLPAAVMVGMKAAGVESRSSWGRMLLSDAFSVALLTGATQGLKAMAKVERPNGSDRHSFPSGHTATAFMTATMLSKEYGYKSPWISVGAYSVATATGLMRIANNKHWLSDVMVGAGVGIIATEFGYWIADAICKERGINVADSDPGYDVAQFRNPSFLALYMGFNLPLSKLDLGGGNRFSTSTGTTVALEGAWFANRYVGVGGRAAIADLQYSSDGSYGNTFNYYTAMAGTYFSLPVTRRWTFGSKALLGGVWYPKTHVTDALAVKNSGFAAGTGVSVDYQVRSNLAGSVFLDYNVLAPANNNSGKYMHQMTLGAKAAVRF